MLPLAELSARLNAEGSGLLAQLNAQVTNQPNPSAEDNTVEQLLKKLLAKLGITVEDLNAMPEEQATAALTALTALVDKASQTDGLKTQLAALSADAGKGQTVDLSQYVPVATVNALREQLATLTAENGVLTVEQTVKAAIDEGKAFACEQEYLVALGKQSLTALTANLDARKPLAALSAKQTTTVDVPNKDKDNKLAALTAEDISVAEQMGLSLEAMADAKKAQR
jgi:phage I-like protein